MANNKEVVSGAVWTSDFVQELVPVAQRTPLLYHLSYLCLANFPALERLLRSRALETQLLFGSSEALLLQCIGTSKNLVETLFPMLSAAVEKNRPVVAVKYLEKARTWISKIISDVEEIVKRYSSHNHDVATTTSDVITTKIETDQKIKKETQEAELAEATLEKYKDQLKVATNDLIALEQKLNQKNREIEALVRDVTSKNTGLGILSAMVPFIGAIIHSIYKAATEPAAKAKIQALENEINMLIADKTALKQKEWTLQNEVISWQMQAAKQRIDLGTIPSPEHLDEVQVCLSRIQQILVQLQKFWEKMDAALETLKQKTFAGEDLIEDLDIFKDEFLASITEAKKAWSQFGALCAQAYDLFGVQAKDAYKFLEVSPSSLSKEEWQKQYDAVKEKLVLIYPSPPAIEEPAPENPPAQAITE